MIPLANVLIAVGVIGIFESTVGSIGFAWLLSKLRRKTEPKEAETELRRLSLDFLIPAHNEESLICKTLTALDHAKEFFILQSISCSEVIPQIRLRVGLDHCTDRTQERIAAWSHSRRTPPIVTANRGPIGKWNVLRQLVHESNADWIAFVDVGSVWHEGLLSAAFPHLRRPSVIGIAPSYRQESGSLLENLQWRLESWLKLLESDAGGPVSVHGATVIYRRKFLLEVFQRLNRETWLNDDVVIPLSLRTHWPFHRIVYLTAKHAWVRDLGAKASREYGRRKRIVLGNLQWIRSLYPTALRSNLCVGLLASRRVFRAFWAYWLLAISLGLALHTFRLFHFQGELIALSAAFLALFLFFPFEGGLQRLRSAFFAGLEIPYHLFHSPRTTPEKPWN